MKTSFANINAHTTAEICARYAFNQPSLRDEIAPREFVYRLVANRQYLAGIDFMAHGLPPRDAIWWGCLCLQHAYGNNLCESEKAACKAAIRWVLEPSEANCSAAKQLAGKTGHDSAAGLLAAASHQAGEASCQPDGDSKSSFAPAKSVARAIKLASTRADPSRIVDSHRLFLELGIGVAEGRFARPGINLKDARQK